MHASKFYPVEMLHRPAAYLRMRPRTRGNYTRLFNEVYAEAHGVGLVTDVFHPEGPAAGLAVIDVVSGGWHADRVSLNEHLGLGVIDALCDRGLTVFAVSPGSIDLFTGSEMTHHVQAAIRNVKSNADRYGIDPRHVGLMGVSAGGHLASLAALTPKKGRSAAHDPLRRWSTEVACAAVFFPPTDLLDYHGMRFDRFRLEGLDPGRLLFREGVSGHSDAEIVEKLTALSPARIAMHEPPPFIIVQGRQDPIVPWEQAEKLAEALRRAGGTVNLVYHETGGHLWPDIQGEIETAAAWLAGTLTAHRGVENNLSAQDGTSRME